MEEGKKKNDRMNNNVEKREQGFNSSILILIKNLIVRYMSHALTW